MRGIDMHVSSSPDTLTMCNSGHSRGYITQLPRNVHRNPSAQLCISLLLSDYRCVYM